MDPPLLDISLHTLTHRNIATYVLSGVAATAVIVRVLYGRFLKHDPEAIVRVSIENLMTQLVSGSIVGGTRSTLDPNEDD